MKKLSARPRENEAIKSFLKDVYKNAKVIPIKVEEARSKRPDFYFEVDHENVLVEIKEIHELTDNLESARWSEITRNLKKEITNDVRFSEIKGLYSVDSTRNLLLSRAKYSEYATQLLNAILDNQDSVKLANHSFTIKRFDSEINDIVFAGFGEVRSIDSAGIILANIVKKVKTANAQLSYKEIKSRKKILLLVNHFYIGSTEDVIKALSRMYDDLLSYNSIDEIWLQQGKTNTLICSREFLDAFEKDKLNPDNKIHTELFERWYWSLEELDGKQTKILNAFKKFFSLYKPHQIFRNSHKRQSMVKFGGYLLKIDDIQNTLWIINRFFDDPDPLPSRKYRGKSEFNYDKKIRNNQDINTITTVQGHLAWVVKELARKSTVDDVKNLEIAFKLTKDKLSISNQNLYIVLQWLFPLIEVSNRRLWIAKENIELYKEFRNLILDRKTGLVKRYSKYKGISRNLIQLFNFFKDLNSRDAEYVIKKLIHAPEADAILVYLALYRENHYKAESEAGEIVKLVDRSILNFDSSRLKKLLKTVLTSDDNYQLLREKIAWQFWNIIKDESNEFCHIYKWINLMFEQPYSRSLFSKLEMIIEDRYGNNTDCGNPCHEWLKLYIKKTQSFLLTHPEESNDIWLSVDTVLNDVARTHPHDLITIIEGLADIWKRGAYIGDIKIIFESYRQIEDSKLREEMKNELESIYKELKVLNLKLVPAIFE